MGIPDKSASADRRRMFYWQVDRPFDERETAAVFLSRHSHFRPDDVARAVTAGMVAYGLPPDDAAVVSVGSSIDSGSVNLVSRVTLGNGMVVYMRQHPDHVPNGYFWAEKAATDAARKAGVPTYETYWIDDSMASFPFAYMIVSAVGGTIMNKTVHGPAEDTALVRETGRLASVIHTIPTARYGFFDNTAARGNGSLVGIHDAWRDHLFAALEDNIAYLRDKGVVTKEDADTIGRIFSSHDDLVACPRPVLIHNDIADWNELCEGDRITGIMDWDECFSGDPVMEFAAWRLFFPEERFSHFVEGYRAAASLPDGYTEKMPLYMLRYVVAKSVLRRKKLETGGQTNLNMKALLEHAMRTMHELFGVFGYAHA